MKYYIAGPMTGYKHFNFPAFDKARNELIGQGYEVISPADLDRQAGLDAMTLPEDSDWSEWGDILGSFDHEACFDRDIAAVRSADRIYMLDGWERSRGALAEKHLAEWVGVEVEYQTEPTNEVRVVNEETGGEKGSKLARFELIPAKPLWDLAEHFGKGCLKYSDRNWERGYDWSLSYGAAQRHLNQFWAGEDVDPETGSKHVIAAAWHCLALAQFMDQNKELDNRV